MKQDSTKESHAASRLRAQKSVKSTLNYQRLPKNETVAARVRAGSGSGVDIGTSELGVLLDSGDDSRETRASSLMSLEKSAYFV